MATLRLRRTDGGNYISSDGRFTLRETYRSVRLTTFDIDDSLGLVRTPSGMRLGEARRWIGGMVPVPPRVDVHRAGDGFYRVHTPLGTWTIDHVRYGKDEKDHGFRDGWVLIWPGRRTPDEKADTMKELVDAIGCAVEREIDHKGRGLDDLGEESWRLEYHADGSTWAPLCRAFFEQARSSS